MGGLGYAAVSICAALSACEVPVYCDTNADCPQPYQCVPGDDGRSVCQRTSNNGAADLGASATTLPQCLHAGKALPAAPRRGSTSYGSAVAISSDGATILVGDPAFQSSQGAVFAIPRSDLSATTTLNRPSSVSTDGLFGAALDASSAGVLVGAAAQRAPAAIAYLYSGALTGPPTELKYMDAKAQSFGDKVALSATRAAIAGTSLTGPYVVQFDLQSMKATPLWGGTLTQQIAALATTESYTAITIQTPTLPSSVQVVLADGTLVMPALTAPMVGMGYEVSNFGSSLAPQSRGAGFPAQLLVGYTASAALDHPAYAFSAGSPSSWQLQKGAFDKHAVMAADTSAAIAFARDYVAVGIPNQAKVLVYSLHTTPWSLLTTIAASDGASNSFGAALSTSGNTLVVGAPASDPGTASAYLFECQ